MQKASTEQPVSPEESDSGVLQAQINELESELADLQLLHEIVISHGTELENELIELVETLSRVATDLEKGEFDPSSLTNLVDRPDELGQLGRAFQAMGYEVNARDRRLRMLRVVIPSGVALSAEKDYGRLLETIVVEAQQLCNADGGILYLITDKKKLESVIVQYDSIGITMGGTSGNKVTFPLLSIYNDQDQPNYKNLVSRVALSQELINIPDVHKRKGEAISAIKSFDKKYDYLSKSYMAIPLKDENDEVIGVLQLVNAKDRHSGELIPFIMDDVIEALVLLGSAALSGYKREESLRKEIEQLHIQIDVVRRDREVAEILESDYFQDLQRRAKEMREKRDSRK